MAFEESRGSADLRAHAPTAHPRLGDALDANDAILGQFRGVAMIEQRFPTQARLNPVARSCRNHRLQSCLQPALA